MQVAMNSHTPELTVLAHGAGSEDAVPKEEGIRVLRRPRLEVAEQAPNVFVLAQAIELPDVSDFVSAANRRHQLRALFVRDDENARWLPYWFERAGLRTLRNTLVHSDWTLPRRVLTAWLHGAQNELIADANVLDDSLFVVSCALDRYEVPFDKVPALKSISRGERTNFELDEDGSFLHWPEPDIHVVLDAIRAFLEPEWRERALAARTIRDRRYGAAIARLRTARGLKQSEIKGLSERQVRRIERGKGTTLESLRGLATAHGLDLKEYLHEIARTIEKSDGDVQSVKARFSLSVFRPRRPASTRR